MDMELHNRASALYWTIRKRAEEDQEYIQLRTVAEELEERYEAAVSALPQEIREVIELYITARENMNLRLLEFACGEIVSR